MSLLDVRAERYFCRVPARRVRCLAVPTLAYMTTTGGVQAGDFAG
jgi:hypothetical protein